jgi:hypothetical protein
MNIDAVVPVKQLVIVNGCRHTTSNFDNGARAGLHRAYVTIMVKEGKPGAQITQQRRRAPGTRDVAWSRIEQLWDT